MLAEETHFEQDICYRICSLEWITDDLANNAIKYPRCIYEEHSHAFFMQVRVCFYELTAKMRVGA